MPDKNLFTMLFSRDDLAEMHITLCLRESHLMARRNGIQDEMVRDINDRQLNRVNELKAYFENLLLEKY